VGGELCSQAVRGQAGVQQAPAGISRQRLQRVCVVGGTLHRVESLQRSAFCLAYLSLCGQDDGLVVRLVQPADQL
jgi:hypothetical protein